MTQLQMLASDYCRKLRSNIERTETLKAWITCNNEIIRILQDNDITPGLYQDLFQNIATGKILVNHLVANKLRENGLSNE